MMKKGLFLSIAYLLCAIAAIHVGVLGLLGFDLGHYLFTFPMLKFLTMPFDLIIGLAGLYALYAWIMCAMGKECLGCK